MGYLKRLCIGLLLVAVCGSALPAAPLTPFLTQISKNVRRSAIVRQNPGMNRMRWMRFYFPSTTVARQDGVWEKLYHAFNSKDEQRAVAFYLYQMYVSAAAYGQMPSGELTINQLGVLDGLEKLTTSFDVRDVQEFYQDNKPEIKAWLKQFFDKVGLRGYRTNDPLNDVAERQFLQILANSADGRGRACYLVAAPKWKSALRAQDIAWLTRVQQSTERDIGQKVALYKVPKATLSALDKRIGNKGSGQMAYLFRPAGQECAARAYLTGSSLCRQMKGQPSQERRLSRIYQLHLEPTDREFLKPARGNRFRAPNGKVYPDWYYHEAVLVVLHHANQYTPVVLDKFLSDKPIVLEKWLAYFNPRTTLIYASPFQRWEETESSLVLPDRTSQKGIWKNGRLYRPYPVDE